MKLLLVCLTLLVSIGVNSMYTAEDLRDIIEIIVDGRNRYFSKLRNLKPGECIAVVILAQELAKNGDTYTEIGDNIVLKIEGIHPAENEHKVSQMIHDNETAAYKFQALAYTDAKNNAESNGTPFDELRLPLVFFSGMSKAFKNDESFHASTSFEVLGTNLYTMFFGNRPEAVMIKTLFGYAVQIMKYLKFLKSINFMHLDVKPDNFVLDPTDPTKIVPIDLAFSKFPGSKDVFANIDQLTTYTSLNKDKGGEITALEDAEGFLIMFVEILTGFIPWDLDNISKSKTLKLKKKFPKFILENLISLPELAKGVVAMLTDIRKHKKCEFELITELEKIIAAKGDEVLPLPPIPQRISREKKKTFCVTM